MATPDPINVSSVTITTTPLVSASAVVQGFQGIQGLQGVQGATGATGERGPTGVMPNDYVSSVNGRTGSVQIPLATTGSTGVASFNQNHFFFGPGQNIGRVSLQGFAPGEAATFVKSFNAQNGHVVFGVPIASYSVTGSAMFDRDDFEVSQYGMVRATGNHVRVLNGMTGNISLTGTGAILFSQSGKTGTFNVQTASASVTGVASFGNEFVVSAAGAVSLTSNYVKSINGLTGAVTFAAFSAAVPLASATTTGAASFGNEFVVSAAGAVSLTSNYVKSINGLTGTITGIATTGSNTFADLQTMNAGLSADSIFVSNGVIFKSKNIVLGEAFKIGNGGVTGALGVNNVAVGVDSLRDNTLGNDNVAIGYSTLSKNLTGNNNVAIGAQSLADNSVGFENVAIGYSSLGKNLVGYSNVAIGSYSQSTGMTNSESVSIGRNSLERARGTAFVAIGHDAGRRAGQVFLLSGTGSIFIGHSSKASANLQTNEIVIGTNAVGLGSNTAVIGATTQSSATIYGLLNPTRGISAPGATFSNDIYVIGNTTLLGNVTLNDNAARTTTFKGPSTFEQGIRAIKGGRFDDGISISGSTLVTGNANFDGDVSTTQGLSANRLYVSNGVTFNSTSVHTGLATFNGGMTVTGNTVFLDTVAIGGATAPLNMGGTAAGATGQIMYGYNSSIGGWYIYLCIAGGNPAQWTRVRANTFTTP